MKKALALLIAIAAVMSLSVTAFADGMPQGFADNFNPGNVYEVSEVTPSAPERGFDYLEAIAGDDESIAEARINMRREYDGLTGSNTRSSTNNNSMDQNTRNSTDVYDNVTHPDGTVITRDGAGHAPGINEGVDGSHDLGRGLHLAPNAGLTGPESRQFDSAGSALSMDIGQFDLELVSGQLTINANEMFYVWERGHNVVGASQGDVLIPGTILTPGHIYRFDIHYATADRTASPSDFLTADTAPVTRASLLGGNLRVRNVRGSSSVATATLREVGSGDTRTYRLEVDVKEAYGTRLTDLEYAMEVVGGTSDLLRSGVAFRAGFQRMTDAEVELYSEGDVFVVYNDRPVILKDQFNELARNYNYRNVTIENDDATWTFTTRVSGMVDTNFYNTQGIVPNIIMDYPDTDFKFFNFHGGVRAPANGELRLNVSDISGDFERMYVYLTQGGALTPINAVHDRESDEIVFRTNYLGTFVISNEELPATALEPGTDLPYQPGAPTAPSTNNPATGAGSAMSILALIGTAGIAGAGLTFRRRK